MSVDAKVLCTDNPYLAVVAVADTANKKLELFLVGSWSHLEAGKRSIDAQVESRGERSWPLVGDARRKYC